MKEPTPRASWQVWLLAALTLACLAPFLFKAVHMDDPLFVWTARHIQKDPFNFYGFDVNWYGYLMPMSRVMQNPPLAAYYMALVGSLLGWSEAALHFGFLWAGVAAILGIYFLALEFCGQPLLPALTALASPAFLVSAASLMCDTMMLAFWVWAVFFWVRGLARQSHPLLALSAALVAASALTKYFGLSLVPLLAVYALMTTRKLGWLPHLGSVLVIMGAYDAWTHHLYGGDLLFNAIAYAPRYRVGGDLFAKIPTALSFAGGCMFIVPACIPLLWGKRGAIAAALIVVGLALIVAETKTIGPFSVVNQGTLNWLLITQWCVFVVGGLAVLVLAAQDLMERKDAKAVLLALWVLGTFVFASMCNWTVAARNILPMVPAIALLLVRRLEAPPLPFVARKLRLLGYPLALASVLSLAVCYADFQWANSERTAAWDLCAAMAGTFKAISFEGHWGFQYYMEQFGAVAFETENPQFSPDRAIILPLGKSNVRPLPRDRTEFWNELDYVPCGWMAVMNGFARAGFYSDICGPVPFLFCGPPAERYQIYCGK